LAILKGKIEQIISQDSSFYSRYLIGAAKHAMEMSTRKVLAKYHISPQQAQILFIIYNLRKTTLAELAKHTARGNNTVSKQTRVLIKEGLLKKIRETPKSTLLSFELTEKGFDAFNFSNDRIKADREIMSVLSEEERQQLISMLNKIITKAETHRNSI
jgi:DNA-binding MarR family transcriptional regulator